MASFEDVEAGDKFIIRKGFAESVAHVTKVTKTRFECGGITFLKANGKAYGVNKYPKISLSIFDSEVVKRKKEEAKKNRMADILNYNVNFNDLDIETLKKVLNALEIKV